SAGSESSVTKDRDPKRESKRSEQFVAVGATRMVTSSPLQGIVRSARSAVNLGRHVLTANHHLFHGNPRSRIPLRHDSFRSAPPPATASQPIARPLPPQVLGHHHRRH